jgi:hypothetical protein
MINVRFVFGVMHIFLFWAIEIKIQNRKTLNMMLDIPNIKLEINNKKLEMNNKEGEINEG